MKRILLSITLGSLVFFLSYTLLNEEPEEEARVLSTLDTNSAQNVERTDSVKNNSNEAGPVKKSYEPAVTVPANNNMGITPERIEIPAIDVNAPVQALGYTDKGGMAVPNNLTDVGWFEPGTKPGSQGNAVLAGHVDGRSGPAVFFDLKKLIPGDQIHLYNKDGTKRTFIVQRLEAYPFENAPLREIFGPANHQGLNLITCTGPYDDEASTYSERLAVYTVLDVPQES
ncbi:class F sortase [Halobacillus litoralis]|uniref:class F sortase n=1 Tax=Halobacillus litoralis TaxID=45668 RepID=UPI001CFC7E20|nr:class F sortase [Halobacillus litoralis]